MFLQGQLIAHYHVLHLIGAGAMGDVYLAEDPRIKQQVAIKVMRAELLPYPTSTATSQALHRFQKEATAIASLDHPHILPLFSYGEQRMGEMTLIYLVMPYRPEGSLTRWLSQRPQHTPLSPLTVAHIIQQAANALQHAHDRGIIHQDVKPSNFLIRERKETPERPDLLLADFGIARLIQATSVASQSVHGTPVYMAPEQCFGHAVAASDQYALAIMAYELLTGHPPFQGASMQIMFQHLHTFPQPPRTFNPHLSEGVDTVILQALAKQAEERFASISAFSQAFSEAVEALATADEAPIIAIDSTEDSTDIRNNAPASRDHEAELVISETEAQNGTSRILTLTDGRTLHIQLPPGIHDGHLVCLDSQGHIVDDTSDTAIIQLTIRIKQETETVLLASPPSTQNSTLLLNIPAPVSTNTHEQDKSTLLLADSPIQPPLTPTGPARLLPVEEMTPVAASSLSFPAAPSPVPQKHRSLRLILSLVVLLMLIVSGSSIAALVGLFHFPFSQRMAVSSGTISPGSPSLATVTIIPRSKHLEQTYHLTAVTTTPDATSQQVSARLLSQQTAPATETVPATGATTLPATQASGILTLYNYSTTASVTLTAGTTLPNQQSVTVTMILDSSITVPPASDPTNPPTGTVAAHVAQTGSIGNLPPVNNADAGFYYCTNCAGNTVKGWEIENDSAFSGGHDAQTTTTVQQQDIDTAASALEASNAPQPQHIFQSQLHTYEQFARSPQCTPTVNTNHAVGDAVANVTVTVTFTCTAEVYDQQGARTLAASLLHTQASNDLGSSYSLSGNIVTTLPQVIAPTTNSATIALNVTAQGTWVFQLNVAQQQQLVALILGKTQQQAQTLLLNQPGVQQAIIEVSGTNNILPVDVHRIHLVIQEH